MSGYQSGATYDEESYSAAGQPTEAYASDGNPFPTHHDAPQQHPQLSSQPYPGSPSASFGRFSIHDLKDPKVILRIVEWFLALLAMSLAGSVKNDYPLDTPGYHSFFMFVSITAFLLDMMILAIYFVPLPTKVQRFVAPSELVISCLWVFFWFAGATAFAVQVNDQYGGPNFANFPIGTARAAAAFGFFAFFAWFGSALLSVRRFQGVDTGVPTTYSDL